MQDLNKRKSKTVVVTAALIRRRSLVVELHPSRPHELLIREQGRRSSSGYWVGFESIFSLGAKQKADEVRFAKMAEKKARRKR